MSNEPQQSVDVECQHESVNYTDPMTCMKCGAVVGDTKGKIHVVQLTDLSPEKQAAVGALAEALPADAVTIDVDVENVPAAINMRRPLKTRAGIERKAKKTDAKPAAEPAEATEPKKKVRGAITSIEAANAKERIFVVNGVKFYAAVTDSGFRILSACHESKKTLESAGRVLEIKGWTNKVKRSKEDASLFVLEAKEKRPSGPWPDEDASDAKPEEKKD